MKQRNPNWKLPRNQVVPDKRDKLREKQHQEELKQDGQPDWEQEWSDFGEVYDDDPTYI
tara:strand:- start:2661 stop:2837 length:177 start_codon:yes stop_codon:yes gene_type:complete